MSTHDRTVGGYLAGLALGGLATKLAGVNPSTAAIGWVLVFALFGVLAIAALEAWEGEEP